MKRRGGYAGNLDYQIRLRIPSDMFNLLMDISDKAQVTFSKVMRDVLRLGLTNYPS
jgi:hypothetical protein